PAGAALAPTGRPGPTGRRGLTASRVEAPDASCRQCDARPWCLVLVSDTPVHRLACRDGVHGVSDTCVHPNHGALTSVSAPHAPPSDWWTGACGWCESRAGLGRAGRPVGARVAPAGGRGRLVARPSRATWPARTPQPRPGRPTKRTHPAKTYNTAARTTNSLRGNAGNRA